MGEPLVSVNIVTWNGGKYLPALLHSLQQQTFHNFSILIIDNGSQDNTLKWLGEYYPQLKIVRNKSNLGFAKAHNQGINWTKSKYVLLVNQDTMLTPNFIEELVNFAEGDPQVGALTGKLFYFNADNQEKTKIIDSCGLIIKKNHQAQDLYQGEDDNKTQHQPLEVFGVSGALPFYRREALESIQINGEYFDENFFMYKEDVDLAWRLRWRGWQSWCVPQAIGYHQRTTSYTGRNLLETIKQRRAKSKFVNYHSYKNHWFVLIKNETIANLLRCLPWWLWFELKQLGYILLLEWSSLKAFKDILKFLAKMWHKRSDIMKRRLVAPKEIYYWFK